MSDTAMERIRELERQLLEANETLDAIRNGEVDAVVVGGPSGQVVYTLENADRPYRVLVEQMREGAVTLSATGVILYCNRSFADFLGQRPEDVVGHPIFALVSDPATLHAMLSGSGKEGGSAEISILLPNDGVAPANLSVAELSVEDGADRMFCLIVTDLRHNYARAQELAQANQRLASEIADRTRAEQSLAIALDAAEMGSWDLNLSKGTAIRSATHDTIFGHNRVRPWSLDDAIGHFVPEDREAVSTAFETARTSGRLDFEKRIRRAGDGAVRWVHVRGSTFYGDHGPERIAGIIVDNTDRRFVDEQLRQGQKMEAIGQLTGGIAHDFNNLLMIIGGSLESLSRRVELDDRVQRLLDAAQMGVARGAKLNEQLLSFARRQDMHDEVVCLPDLLPRFETLLDRAVGEAVAVRLDLATNSWFCKADPHQLETAVLNLAINARDAMEGVGTLIISSTNSAISGAEAEPFEAVAGDYVMLNVKDDGPGMSPEVAARVFEPFFTTKALGKGTGLGLSQVYGFARQSGGFVKLESIPGAGASISIYLPRCVPLEGAENPTQVVAELGRSDGSVLLVEDDPDVRAATSAMLEELGYSITAAGSGDQALEILSSGTAVDIVFSDVIMVSGMNGIELARLIQAERPTLPILLTSGYTAQWMVPSAINSDLPLLRKPYTLAQLSEALAKLSTGSECI